MARKKTAEVLDEIEDAIEDLDMDGLDDLEIISESDDEVETDEVVVAEGFSAKEAALKIGTDARSLRKFLRSRSGLVGQGNRWVIDPADIAQLKIDFENYSKPKLKEVAVIVAPDVDDDDDIEIEDLDFTDED